jgi:hypothetical protein
VRLRENQVPQNTPITREKSTMVVAWAARIFTARSSALAVGWRVIGTLLGLVVVPIPYFLD